MKIRTDFVSNSSSSSFIIGIPKSMFGKFDPNVAEYHPNNLNINKFAKYAFPNLSLNDSIERISKLFKFIPEQPSSEKEILDRMSDGWFEGCPEPITSEADARFEREYSEKNKISIADAPVDSNDYKKWIESGRKSRLEYEKLKYESANKYYELFLNKSKGMVIYKLEIDSHDNKIQHDLVHSGELDSIPHLLVTH